MADSIKEKIIQNIKTVLEVISVANGYNNDFANVQRWLQSGNDTRQVPCIIISMGVEDKSQGPDPLITCRLTIDLDIWYRHDEDTVPGSTDAILNSLLADVEKALMIDVTRGGFAVDTILTGNLPFEAGEGQPYAGIIAEIEIVYRHKLDDPFTAG